MIFDADFVRARDGAGRDIVFTRAEAIVLRALAARPGRVTPRAAILDAMEDDGTERTDRSVDVLVTRIRRKLGDRSGQPRFIATRYGEGYVWLGEAQMPAAARPSGTARAFAVLAPLRGTERLGPLVARAQAFRGGLEAGIVREGEISVFDAVPDGGAGRVFTLELAFLRSGHGLECVVSARYEALGRIFFVRRIAVEGTADTEALAADILAAYWSERVAGQRPLVSLQVAMHDAALVEPGDKRSWNKNDRRFERLLLAGGGDPMTRLMHAAHLHTKYVLTGWEVLSGDADPRASDEETIEGHVLATLDFVQGRPELAALSAKLLYFLDRGYDDLANELAQDALSGAAGLAASFGMIGQLRAFMGDTEGAFELFDEADAVVSDTGEERAWLLSLIAQAALAAGDDARLQAARRTLLRQNPKTAFLDILMCDPARPSLLARGTAMAMTRRRAKGFLRNWWYIAGRLYRQPRHRDRVMRTPETILARRFGEGVLAR